MVLKIFTKEDGPESRNAKELGEKLQGEGYRVEFLDADNEESVQLVELYDLYSFPTFLVTKEDGTQIEIWRGQVPLESDVKMFLLQ